MARLCSQSRVWAGIHFRITQEHSERQAAEIARRVVETSLLPVRRANWELQ
jgi:hypothetical protein